MDTRIKKLENGDYDGILLSKAGIEALGLDNKITQEFNTEELIPCAGQGIIAIQCRENDQEIINILEKINDNQSRIIANAERNVLKILEGDCDTAVGVYSKISKDIIYFNNSLSLSNFSITLFIHLSNSTSTLYISNTISLSNLVETTSPLT